MEEIGEKVTSQKDHDGVYISKKDKSVLGIESTSRIKFDQAKQKVFEFPSAEEANHEMDLNSVNSGSFSATGTFSALRRTKEERERKSPQKTSRPSTSNVEVLNGNP